MTANDIQLSNLQDWYYAVQQRNLVYNYDFTLFSNQGVVDKNFSYGHPDGWMFKDQGGDGSIGFNTQLDACSIVTGTEAGKTVIFSQALHEFPRWKNYLQGYVVKAVVELSVSAPCSVTLQLEDGLDASAKQITDQSEFSLEVTHLVSSSATELILSISCSDPNITINITKAYANRGEIALEDLPCMVTGVIGQRKQYVATEIPPATELSLCSPTQELTSDHSRLSSVLNGKFGLGSNKMSKLPDMRGYFSRAWDHGASNDPDASSRLALDGGSVTGDNVGTVQEDAFKSHNHGLEFNLSGVISMGDAPYVGSLIPMSTNTSQTDNTGNDETRSKNIYELYTIKWA